MKEKDNISGLAVMGGTLSKDAQSLSAMDDVMLFENSREMLGRSYFDQGFSWSHPSESMASAAFSAWRNFDALP